MNLDNKVKKKKILKNTIKTAVRSALKKPSQFSEKILNDWFFSSQNNSLYLVHEKNAEVTNLQYIEIKSLINKYTRSAVTHKKQTKTLSPIFYSTKNIKSYLDNLYESIAYELITPKKYKVNEEENLISIITKTILQNHIHIFENTIIIDHYFTSTTIHHSICIDIDLQKIVAEAGYIYSGGELIYARNINKVNNQNIAEKLKNPNNSSKKMSLVVFADEYFAHDSGSLTSIKNGLSEMMLKAKKHHFQNMNLDDFLLSLNAFHNVKNLHILPNDHLKGYKGAQKDSIKNQGVTNLSSIWVVTDKNLILSSNERFGKSGDMNYVFFYKQLYKNDNPLKKFKERKPGWVQSVTLPHTLSRAIFNIAAESVVKPSNEVRIFDPFVGSGTTLMDAVSVFKDCAFTGLDKDKYSSLMVKINLKFFAMSPEEIKQLLDDVKYSDFEEIEDEIIGSSTTYKNNFKLPLKMSCFINRIIRPSKDRGLDSKLSDLNQDDFKFASSLQGDDIIYFFVAWRALCLHKFEILRAKKNNTKFLQAIKKALRTELQVFKTELEYLQEHKRRKIKKNNDGFILADGLFSLTAYNDLSAFSKIASELDSKKSQQKHKIKIVQNSVDYMSTKLEKNSFDIIVTDPPYGFNTDEGGHSSLHDMYSQLFANLARVLDYGGQLFVCLPANAKTGKVIPFYQTRRPVVQRILNEFKKQNKNLITIQNPRMLTGNISEPPFYWGNNSAISRDVLHFTVEQKRNIL